MPISLGPPIPMPPWFDPGPDISLIDTIEYIDNNFWHISKKVAKQLCPDGQLPRIGYEMCVDVQGYKCYVIRTRISWKDGDRTTHVPSHTVWALHTTNSKFRNQDAPNSSRR